VLAPIEMNSQQRVIINTTLSLVGSAFATMVCSYYFRGKFEMEDLQNATLAGGVAIGSSSDLVIKPYAALLIGTIAGIVSSFG